MKSSLPDRRNSREPRADRAAARSAFAAASPIEVILLLAMLVVAVGSGSLTLLGETIQSILITATRVWPAVALARMAGGARQHYEFGAGKLEQAGNMAIALALAAAGLWLASRAFPLITVGKSDTEPLGLALAATVNALYTVRIGCSLWARMIVNARDEQPIPGVPSRAGISRFASLLFVQAALTVAAFAKDQGVAVAADCLGAIVVGLLMTTAGVRMLWQAVLDLIDHPLRSRSEQAIAQLLLEQGVHPEELVDMRSRRSGRDVFVELTMNPLEAPSFEESRQRLARVRKGLKDRLGADVSIRLYSPES
jgi:divalent metal cation (Fe/Co/Zn/Cd) transporter